jgi:hypothetical protein
MAGFLTNEMAESIVHQPIRQHRLHVFVIIPCQNLFHGLHVVLFPHVQAQLVVFGRDVLILQSAEKGFVGW